MNTPPGSVDLSNTSLVTVFSMSSLELGPVSYNPVVYAADPRLLDETGVLVDVAETWLPAEVTRVATSTSGPAGPSAYSARSPG